MWKLTNVLDPIRDSLDPAVFNNADSIEPQVKPKIAEWVKKKVYKIFKDAGWPDPDRLGYVHLVLTGSLTTYQWSEESDFDISIWIKTERLPEWVRADLIALMIEKAEGIIVPGTTHPLQVFVVDSRKIQEGDIYKLGLRSAYDLDRMNWLVIPEKDRAVDVSKVYPEKLAWAKMVEDKIRILLRYDKAALKVYWDFIHRQRMLSQRRGEGDFCLAPGTKVLTEELTWKPIEELEIGDVLVGFDEECTSTSKDGSRRGQQRKLRKTTVLSKSIQVLPSYRIVTDTNPETFASEDHMWLVRSSHGSVVKWKRTAELRVGDKILRLGDVWDEPVDLFAAHYLAGLFDGEGCLYETRLSFSQKEGSVLRKGCDALNSLGFSYTEYRVGPEYQPQYDHATNVVILGSTPEIMRFLSQVPSVRLREKQDFWVGREISQKNRWSTDRSIAVVKEIQAVGKQEVIGLSTSTKTLVANGLYSHNSDWNICYKLLANSGLFQYIEEATGEHIA